MKSTTFFTFLLPALSTLFLAPSVDAHGYVSFFAVDGTAYAGNAPGGTTNPSPIRQISTISPVKGANNTNMKCGQDAQNAALVVNAMPGSKISFQWDDGDGNWPHNTGPLMTYMASCGSTTCDKFDPTNAQWFKIDQAGKNASDPSLWVQQDIMNGMSFSTTIPSTLASGQYLIRHEIIALHLAVTLGGAEFYPSCTQVNVGGSQAGTATGSELVSFPGAYSDTDPGIYDPNVFDPGSSYVFPGPAVAAIAAGDTSSTGNPITAASPGSTSPSGSPGSSSKPPSVSPSSTSSSVYPASSNLAGGKSSSSCTLTQRSLVKRHAGSDSKGLYPRHISRVMARLAHGNSW